jgi:hypothetical protein
MKYFWTEILKFVPSLVLPTIAGIVLTSVVDIHKIGGFLLAGFLYTIVFVSSMWFWGMNQYEKELIGGPIRRVLLRAKVKRGQIG